MATSRAKSPKASTKGSGDDEVVRMSFLLNKGQRRRFLAKLAASGTSQTDVIRAFVLAYSDGYTTGKSLGLEISVRRTKEK